MNMKINICADLIELMFAQEQFISIEYFERKNGQMLAQIMD
jgi:hypothetical protein